MAIPTVPETDLDRGIVGWNGQADPELPWNFSKFRKWSLLGQISAIAFISPLASSIFAPGLSYMEEEFHKSDNLLASFTVSVFILGYAVGPLFLAPASEMWGRRPVLSAANVFFIVWQIGCALAPNLGSLIAFRFLAGCGGAGALTLIGGVTADLFVPQERGFANSIAAVGVIFGPIIGPLCGGFIAQRAGWRWIFWVLLIASATIGVLLEIFNKETYAPVLIARRTSRLRKELNRTDLYSCYEDKEQSQTPSARFKQALSRPLRMLFLSPIIAICSFYVAVIYGELYLLLTTVSSVYQLSYHWAPELTGLSTLGIGLGSLAGLAFVGSTSDKTVAILTRKNNGIYEPEMRLPSMIFFAMMIPIAFFWYGWTAEKHAQWIVPMLAQIPFGLGLMGIAFPIQIYLIDAFSLHAASAMAALTVSRSLFGALLPLPAPRMYENLGLGWGNSILGFLALCMIPVPYVLWKFGGKIRKEHPIVL